MPPFCTSWSLCITYACSSRHINHSKPINHSNPSWKGGPQREWGLYSHVGGRDYYPSKQEGAGSEANSTWSVQVQDIYRVENNLDLASAHYFSSMRMSACVHPCKCGYHWGGKPSDLPTGRSEGSAESNLDSLKPK